MNQADSEEIASALEAVGIAAVGSMEEAEVIIINTCSVRQASEDKVYGLGAKVKRNQPSFAKAMKDKPAHPSFRERGDSTN